MDVTTALNMATLVHNSKRSQVEDTCVSLYQGSDFINLTKMTALMLQKERVKNAKIESQKEPTFGRWIWKTLKDIGEWIFISEKSKTKIRGDEGEGTIEIHLRTNNFGLPAGI